MAQPERDPQRHEEQHNGGAVDGVSDSVPSAGDLLQAGIADREEVVSFVGRDEPAEFSYDYAEADRRAVEALRRVATSEGARLTREVESEAPIVPPLIAGEAFRPASQPQPRSAWFLARRFGRS